MIHLNQPEFIYKKGKRENLEDYIFPAPGKASIKDKLFIICDGVGGAAKGEVASQITTEVVSQQLQQLNITDLDKDNLDIVMRRVENMFRSRIEKNKDCETMSTTFTLIYFGETKCTIAHAGDSRIYWFRRGKIMHQTNDHSYVNQLYKLGQISEEEMIQHPKKNVILRAVNARNPVELEYTFIDLKEIKKGDYFMLCSDGVMESFTNSELKKLMSTYSDGKLIVKFLEKKCAVDSSDNYSCYLISIDKNSSYSKWFSLFQNSSKKHAI